MLAQRSICSSVVNHSSYLPMSIVFRRFGCGCKGLACRVPGSLGIGKSQT